MKKKLLFLLAGLLCVGSVLAQARVGTISGRVIDESGNPIVGASVEIKSLSRGTSTDNNGLFMINNVSGNSARVTVSYVGKKTVTMSIPLNTVTTVTLREEVLQAEEVVVTGLFNRPGNSFTGTATTVTAEQLARVGSGNLLQSLRNIDPSLGISDNLQYGSDPNRLPDVELRGQSSFPLSEQDLKFDRMYQGNPNQPLFILNGFEVSLERVIDLDMQRVSLVTILKDASAKAIYGAKAANGVVVIETKRATGGELVATYRGSLDLTMPDLTSYELTNAMEKLYIERLSGVYANEQMSSMMLNERTYNTRLNRALAGVNTDWLSKPLRTGVGTKHSVSIDMTKGYISSYADVSYDNEQGVMKGSSRTTISAMMDMQYRQINKLLIRNVMSVTSNKAKDSPWGVFSDYTKMNPYNAPYDENGRLIEQYEETSGFQGQYNPMYNAHLAVNLTADYINFSDNLYAEYTPFEGLTFRIRGTVETQRNGKDHFYPAEHTKFSTYGIDEVMRKGEYTHGVGRRDLLYTDFTVNYNKAIGKHLFMNNFAFSLSEEKSHEVNYIAEGFPSKNMQDIMFAMQYKKDSKPTGWENINRDMAFTGLVGYSYDDRFLADVTLRASASSKYSAKKRWGAFWSLGLAWNMHNEQWAYDLNWLTKLKWRASVGTTGTQNVDNNAYIVTYEYYTDKFYNTGGYPSVGSKLMRLANENLKWQRELQYNVGFDAWFWERLNINFSAYLSTTKDLVSDINISPSTGFFTMKQNIGEVENRGIDFNFSHRIISRDDFYLNLTGALFFNDNKIKKLSDAMEHYNRMQEELSDNRLKDEARWAPVLKYREGKSMSSIWVVPSLGINPQNGREIYVRPDGSTTYDYHAAYQRAMGNSKEKYRGNFGFNGEYKGFGLTLVCRFLGGGQLYNSTLVERVENAKIEENVDRRLFLGRWSQDNRYAPFKRLEPYRDEDGQWVSEPKTQATSRFVQDRNELDIASVSAYYDFGRMRFLRDAGFNRVRLAVNLNDLHKFSSIQIERGTDYPFARMMSLSLTAEF